MKFRIRELTAALVAATAATFAFAQASAPETPTRGLVYADQAMASIPTGAKGANLEAANTIVQAINGDASLKNSKVTVAPEENRILLTGVTPTLQQMLKIVKVATQHAGEGNVVNGINTEEVWLEARDQVQPAPEGQAVEAAQPAEARPAS